MNQYLAKEYPFEGEMLTIREISERIGVPPDTIRERLNNYKMPYERAFSPKDHRTERMENLQLKISVEYNGERVTLTKLSRLTGIDRPTIYSRYRAGDRGERLWRPLDHRGRKGKWYDY